MKKKWAVVEEEIMDEHGTQILLVSETKLMNRERSPRMGEFSWWGNNREGSLGRQATRGMGVLYDSHLDLRKKEKVKTGSQRN